MWIILGIVTSRASGSSVRPVARQTRGAPQRRSSRTASTTYAIAAGALLVLALVAPAIARGWLSALLLIGLIVAGIEVVRRIVLREEPPPVSQPG